MLCDDLEGWDEGTGREAQEREYINIYTYCWFTLLYGRNHHSVVKQVSYN